MPPCVTRSAASLHPMTRQSAVSQCAIPEWIGTPYYPPSAAVRADGRGSVVYASWNGSTQTRAWQVLAGSSPDSLTVVVGHAPRSGFETAVTTTATGPYFQVRAVDASGRVLKESKVVRRPS